MGFLDSMKKMVAPTGAGKENALWLYVRCRKCGEQLAVRINPANELSADYENGGYVLHKDMMDGKCFTLMHAYLRFDDQKNIVEQKLDGGEFITEEEYTAVHSTGSPQSREG